MRKTLHEYTIEQLSDLDCTAVSNVLNYAKLTNRQPKLGDFVPCDDEGNVLEKPKGFDNKKILSGADYQTPDWMLRCQQYQQALDRVIFKGDWEIHYINETETCIHNGAYQISFTKNRCFCMNYVNRIEDLPLDIEFREGLI